MKDIGTHTVAELSTALAKGEVTSVELTSHFLKEAKEKNKDTNAFLEIFDDARDAAKEADARIKKGEKGPLLGIPIALKDNILVKGKKVSAGSKILEHYVATYDSFVTQKLRDAGAVIVGRTNLDEFAMGGSTENSAFGVVKNPHDVTRVAGGSSGGSAAAVAMHAAPVALGSDTGGSIREPAAFCGCVGLKPTYGTVSRNGLIAMGSSLDQIGPFGKSVADAETVFNVIRGYDPKDSTSLLDPKFADTPSGTLTIGVPREFLGEGVSGDVLEHFDRVLKGLANKGYKVVDIELPYIKYALPVYYIIMPAESSTNLARFDGMRYGLRVDGDDLLDDYKRTRGEGFGKEVRRRILLGTYVLSSGYYDAYYGKATAVRKLITDDLARAFAKCDIIATPTAPGPAFAIGERSDPVSMYLTDIFTVPANITGVPGLSVPMGTVVRHDKELPVGLQIMAPHLHEATLFKAGKDIESQN